MTTDVIPYEQRLGALTVLDVRAQVNLIQGIMRDVMKEGEHYGVIPGTKKPSLFKAGAEKLVLTFRFDPQYETTEKYDGAHLTVVSKCTLYHIPSGQRFGSGMGSCSSKESKYAYRESKRKCPHCAKETIIKGKAEYGGGWLCFKKQGGCGEKFPDGDPVIEKQEIGRTPNEDLADQYNTVLKMANKRSLVAAVLNTTAASDIFTQDMEDLPADKNPPAPQQPLGSTPSPAQPAAAAGGPPAKTRSDTLLELCNQTGTVYATILRTANVKHADEMSDVDYDSAVSFLNRKLSSLASAAHP